MEEKKRKRPGHRRKKRKVLNIVLVSIGVVMLAGIIAIITIFNVYTNKMDIVPYVATPPSVDVIKEPEKIEVITPQEIESVEILPEYNDTTPHDILAESDVELTPPEQAEFTVDFANIEEEQAKIRNWYHSGDPIYSENVTNILLIGSDNRSSAEVGRSDAMVMASINKSTRQITLVSFLRDNYTYITNGDSEIFTKLNVAYSMGGPELTVSTIENLFKVRIDNYVVTSMSEFPGIIDTLGGIYLDVESAAADSIGVGHGVQLLNGEKALAYSRYRKVGSDLQRTNRQQMVIFAVMDRFRSSSLSDMNTALNLLLPSIRTGITKTGILGYASTAFFDGWGSYGNSNLSVPAGPHRFGAMYNDLAFWFVDYPAQAQQLQLLLYGATNIAL